MKEFYLQSLDKVSTVDGRECLFSNNLSDYLSESALHKNRFIIEVKYLIELCNKTTFAPILFPSEKKKLLELCENIDVKAIAEYDHFGRNNVGPFEHDVKAVEYYLREKLEEIQLSHLSEWIHFGLTSEDVNNLAYSTMLKSCFDELINKNIIVFLKKLSTQANHHKKTVVLGKTHGMNASPTTIGKRFSYFVSLVDDIFQNLQTFNFSGKFSGAVGNNNALKVVAPDFDFINFAKTFVNSLSFSYENTSNQRSNHLQISRLFNEVKLLNNVLIDFCEHIRHSVMIGTIKQISNKNHVGSSVMPHKINPWQFEVAQGYLEQSNCQINGLSSGIMQSLFERDLTDHPWERSYGEILAKMLISLNYINDALDTLVVDVDFCKQQLLESPEVLTEALQIAGRMLGVSDIYIKIKNESRGMSLNRNQINDLINKYLPDSTIKTNLLNLKLEDYIGDAEEIVSLAVKKYV